MDELTDNHCEICGFDESTWTQDAKIDTILHAPTRLADALSKVEPAALNRRPDASSWSALEYVEHIREVFLHSRLVCEQALENDGQPYDGPFPPSLGKHVQLNLTEVLAALDTETRRNAALFQKLSGNEWDRYGVLLDSKWTLRFALTHTLHELLHHLRDARQSAGTTP